MPGHDRTQEPALHICFLVSPARPSVSVSSAPSRATAGSNNPERPTHARMADFGKITFAGRELPLPTHFIRLADSRKPFWTID
eukprot:5313532-Prymnesium_polylepis.1